MIKEKSKSGWWFRGKWGWKDKGYPLGRRENRWGEMSEKVEEKGGRGRSKRGRGFRREWDESLHRLSVCMGDSASLHRHCLHRWYCKLAQTVCTGDTASLHRLSVCTGDTASLHKLSVCTGDSASLHRHCLHRWYCKLAQTVCLHGW
jgi:hypothetical protein